MSTTEENFSGYNFNYIKKPKHRIKPSVNSYTTENHKQPEQCRQICDDQVECGGFSIHYELSPQGIEWPGQCKFYSPSNFVDSNIEGNAHWCDVKDGYSSSDVYGETCHKTDIYQRQNLFENCKKNNNFKNCLDKYERYLDSTNNTKDTICNLYQDDTNSYNIYCFEEKDSNNLSFDVQGVKGQMSNNKYKKFKSKIINRSYFKRKYNNYNIKYKKKGKSLTSKNPLDYTTDNTTVNIKDIVENCPKGSVGSKLKNVNCQLNDNNQFVCSTTTENNCLQINKEYTFYLDFSDDWVLQNKSYFTEKTQTRNWSKGQSWNDDMLICLDKGNNSDIASVTSSGLKSTTYIATGGQHETYPYYLADNKNNCSGNKCFDDNTSNISTEMLTSPKLANDRKSSTKCQYIMACGTRSEPWHSGHTQQCWAHPAYNYRPNGHSGTITNSYTNTGMDKCKLRINSNFASFNFPQTDGAQECISRGGSGYTGGIIHGCGTNGNSSRYSNYATSFQFPCFVINKYNDSHPTNYTTYIKNKLLYNSPTLRIKKLDFIQYLQKYDKNNAKKYDNFSKLSTFTYAITYTFTEKTTEYDLYYLFSIMSNWPSTNATTNQQQGLSFLYENQNSAYDMIKEYCLLHKTDCTAKNVSKFCCTSFKENMPLFLSKAVTSATTPSNKFVLNFEKNVTTITGGGASQIYQTTPNVSSSNSIPIPSYPQGKDVYLNYCQFGNNWKGEDCKNFYNQMYKNETYGYNLDVDVQNLLFSKCQNPNDPLDSNLSLCACFLSKTYYNDYVKKKEWPSSVITGSGKQVHCWYQPCFASGFWNTKASTCPSTIICEANIYNNLTAGGDISNNKINVNQILNCGTDSKTDSNQDSNSTSPPSVPKNEDPKSSPKKKDPKSKYQPAVPKKPSTPLPSKDTKNTKDSNIKSSKSSPQLNNDTKITSKKHFLNPKTIILTALIIAILVVVIILFR